MNPELPDDALEFGTTARKALEALGGGDYVLRCEDDPSERAAATTALAALGLGDIDPRADLETLAAAAVLCAEAGRVSLPYPVAGALLRDTDGIPFAVVPDATRARIHHGDLFPQWRVADWSGNQALVSSSDDGAGHARFGRLGRFVTDLDLDPDASSAGAVPTTVTPNARDNSGQPAGNEDELLWLTLISWQVLGAAERAVELAADHVSNRVQFGKPIAAFQAVQFMLADAAVAVAGLRELAQFTLWRVDTDVSTATPDVLGLRVHAIDVARSVLRTCQQLHGASGVCDEYDISVITRHIQPALRLPFGAERSAALLTEAIAVDGFVGLFPHGGAHS